jgi:hypothetical protein
MSLLQQLREAADDAVGADRRVGRQADAVAVVPDRIDAEPLRRLDFPFQMVADQSGIRGFDAERTHRV